MQYSAKKHISNDIKSQSNATLHSNPDSSCSDINTSTDTEHALEN